MRWACLLLIFITLKLFSQDLTNITVPDPLGHPEQLVEIGKIIITGNKITREKIILREVEFQPGESLSILQLDEKIIKSRQNLLNRSIFNFVNFSRVFYENKVDVKIQVTERWYIWPVPILNTAGRNLNAWWEDRDPERLNYGVDLRVRNFRGRMELLNIIVQGGYDQTLAAKWTIPYLNENQFVGMGVGGGYQRNRQIAYETVDNKPVFYDAATGYAQLRGFASVDFTLRPRFNYLHTFTLGFEHYQFQDTLLDLNPQFAFNETRYDFLTLSYLYKQDYRDYKPYPLIGYYFDAGISKYGLGIIQSEIDIWSVNFTFDQYVNIYKRWYFAYSFSALFTNQDELPYFLTPGFGYAGWEIRGYELYFIDGQKFGLFKSNFKFEIIPRTVKRIKWMKTDKFGKVFYALYANIFFDLGYASDLQNYETNPLANQLLWGTGLGIDFVTYYDLVIRFEYTINKQGEHGFFINLVAPI
jgi:outer membrane protein assembly factor BamA